MGSAKAPKIDIDGADAVYLLPWAKQMLRRFKRMLPFGVRSFDMPDASNVRIQWGTLDKIKLTSGAVPYAVTPYWDEVTATYNAFVSRQGKPLKPARAKFFMTNLSVGTLELGYRADGLRGSESNTFPLDTDGADTFTPILDGNPFVFPYVASAIGLDDDTFRFWIGYTADLTFTDPYNAKVTRIDYDPSADEPFRWSETTGDLVFADAISASTGVSTLDGSHFPAPIAVNKYTLSSPFPGGLGGSLDIYTQDSTDFYIPQAIVVGSGIGFHSRSYLTAVTPSAVTTAYDSSAIPVAYGCWVEFEGTEQVWVYRRDPDTLAFTTLATYSNNWKTFSLLVYNVSLGQMFLTNGSSTALTGYTPGSVNGMFRMDEGRASLYPPAGVLATDNTVNTPTVFSDEDGNWVVSRPYTDYPAKTVTPGIGPLYLDATNTTQHMDLWEANPGTPTVETVLNGSTIWSLTNPAGAGPNFNNGTAFLQGGTSFGISLAKIRRGKFGVPFQFNDAAIVFQGMFWNGASSTIYTSAAVGGSNEFVWAVSPAQSIKGQDLPDVHIVGFNKEVLKYYEDNAEVLSITLASNEYFRGIDEENPRLFYTAIWDGLHTQTVQSRTYTVVHNEFGWSYTTHDDIIQDTWDYNDTDLVKFYDNFLAPLTLADRGARRNYAV